MTLPAAGAISLVDIASEFGQSTTGSISLEAYYRNGTILGSGILAARADVQTLFGSGTTSSIQNADATANEIYQLSLANTFTTNPFNLDVSESYTSLVSQNEVGTTDVFVTGGTRVTSTAGGFTGGSPSGGVTANVTPVSNTLSITESHQVAGGYDIFTWGSAGTLNFDVRVQLTGFGRIADVGIQTGGPGVSIQRIITTGNGETGNSQTSNGYTFVLNTRVGSGNAPSGAGAIDVTYRITGTVSGAGSIAIRGAGTNPSLTRNTSTFTTYNISYTNGNDYSVTIGTGTTGVGTAFTLGPRATSGTFTGQTTNSPTISGDNVFIAAQSQFTSGTTRGVTASTSQLNSRFNTVTLTGSGQSVSAVNLPAGEVDFTISATPRTDGNLNVLFDTNNFDMSGLTLTASAGTFRVGDGTPASGLGPGRSGWFIFNFGVGNTWTLRVTGTISSARTWAGYAGNIGGAPSHANGNISIVNNALSVVVASGNNDLSTVASETSMGTASSGGGTFPTAVSNAAWYVVFNAPYDSNLIEIQNVTIRNNRTNQSTTIPGSSSSNPRYFQGPVWLNNDGTTPTNVVGNLIPNLSAFPGGIEGGDTFSVTGCSGFRCGGGTVTAGYRTRSTTTSTTRFSVTASNSNSFAITLNSSSTGGGGTVPANGTLLLEDDQPTSAWTLGWDQQNVPSSTVNFFSAHNTNNYAVTVNGISVPANTAFANRVRFADSLTSAAVTARVQASVPITTLPTWSLDLDTASTALSPSTIASTTFPANTLAQAAMESVRSACVTAFPDYTISAVTLSGSNYIFTINTEQTRNLSGSFSCSDTMGLSSVVCTISSTSEGNLQSSNSTYTIFDGDGDQVYSLSATNNQSLSSVLTALRDGVNTAMESPNFNAVVSGNNLVLTSVGNIAVSNPWTITVNHSTGRGDIAFGDTAGSSNGTAARTTLGRPQISAYASIPESGAISLEDFYGITSVE